jgi:cytochrome c553
MRYAPLLLLWLAAAAPDGRQIVLHGNADGALPCAACHGVNGRGNPPKGAPAQAGLPAGSIEAVLAQYKAGQGGNAIMQSIARALSPAETVAVANYFSALPKP